MADPGPDAGRNVRQHGGQSVPAALEMSGRLQRTAQQFTEHVATQIDQCTIR